MPIQGRLVVDLWRAYASGRPLPWIRLDVERDHEIFFAIGDSGVIRPPPSYSGIIRIYNRGRVRFTVKSAGWIAADGERIPGFVQGEETLEPGDPELMASAGTVELLAKARSHGVLTTWYVQLAGEDAPRTGRIGNDWRSKVREPAGL